MEKNDPLLISYKLLQKFKTNNKIIKKIEKEEALKITNAFKFAEKSKFPNKKQLMKNIYR